MTVRFELKRIFRELRRKLSDFKLPGSEWCLGVCYKEAEASSSSFSRTHATHTRTLMEIERETPLPLSRYLSHLSKSLSKNWRVGGEDASERVGGDGSSFRASVGVFSSRRSRCGKLSEFGLILSFKSSNSL